jgi:hypothetical protein
MTVIAYKDGVMAADTMLSAHNSQSRAQKIVRLPDGGVAGGCGLWTRAYSVLSWLADGGDAGARKGDSPEPPNVADAQVLIARPDGSLWLLEDEFPAYPLRDAIASIGCGSDAALMAMTLGLSAVEAVSRVTRQDVLCGDPVQSLEVVPSVDMPALKTHSAKSLKPAQNRRRR